MDSQSVAELETMSNFLFRCGGSAVVNSQTPTQLLTQPPAQLDKGRKYDEKAHGLR